MRDTPNAPAAKRFLPSLVLVFAFAKWIGLFFCEGVEMALNARSTCAQVSNMLMADSKLSSSTRSANTSSVLPLPVKPSLQSSQLRRTKSRKPVKSTRSTRVSASLQGASPTDVTTESISRAVNKVGEEIATTSNEILDVVDSVIEEGAATMKVRKSSGKMASRTSRRRALVMCLALGMVRPCASNVANSMQSNNLRRTVSAGIRRTTSASFKVPNGLVSQVSLASTLQATNLLGGEDDL